MAKVWRGCTAEADTNTQTQRARERRCQSHAFRRGVPLGLDVDSSKQAKRERDVWDVSQNLKSTVQNDQAL